MIATHQRPVELLAPAGSLEKLKVALHYGADAVYLAGKQFSLRNHSDNFTLAQIEEAVSLSNERGARTYVAVNIYARQSDLDLIAQHIAALAEIKPHGLILADPAVLVIAKQHAPEIPIHLSTQANTTNAAAAAFWADQGVCRINAARELSLEEIADIASTGKVAVEAFVHGAMCISYSGRCLMSNYMANRPSNQGRCCQPCRFSYAVVEETRPGQFFSIEEDCSGTYLFNAKDLCMLDHLPAMIDAGIDALKIEGRMKSIHYTATVVNAYRMALDRYAADPTDFRVEPGWRDELAKVTSRGYCTGFYLGDIEQAGTAASPPSPPTHALAGKVLAEAGKCRVHIEVRNQICMGDALEVITPGTLPQTERILHMTDTTGQSIDVAHPGSRATIELGSPYRPMDILRKRVG